jgi:hypothetical protein
MLIAQGDFGCLGIRHETEFHNHIVGHPALSRNCSEKAAKCLDFRSDPREKMNPECEDEALDDICSKITMSTLNTDKSNAQATNPALSFGEPIRRANPANLLRPPRRFMRRTWIRLINRMLAIS